MSALAPQTCLARLTPAFQADCAGRVHSIFHRVVNLEMRVSGAARLMTLISPALPAVPDSLCLPEAALFALSVGEDARLEGGRLYLRGGAWETIPDARWSGRVPRMTETPRTSAFLAAAKGLGSGFDSLPERARESALNDFLQDRWQDRLGLGQGLTPSFDDACVGAMALCQALGAPHPALIDLSVTTDVSARYLTLAREGYFGDPLIALINALFGRADMARAILDLQTVGATSGRDMIYGVLLALTRLRLL